MAPPTTTRTTTKPAPAVDDTDAAVRAGRPRDEAREQAILDATIELVAEVGYDRVTIDGIATRAHASKATIYRRWPGKAELVVDAFKRRFPDPVQIPDLGSLRAELEYAMGIVCTHISGVDGSLLCGLAGASSTDDELAACFTKMIEDKDSPLRDVIERAIARGELPPGATHELVEEAVVSVTLLRSMQRGALDAAFVAHLVDDIAMPLARHTPLTPAPSRAFTAQPTPATHTPATHTPASKESR